MLSIGNPGGDGGGGAALVLTGGGGSPSAATVIIVTNKQASKRLYLFNILIMNFKKTLIETIYPVSGSKDIHLNEFSTKEKFLKTLILKGFCRLFSILIVIWKQPGSK